MPVASLASVTTATGVPELVGVLQAELAPTPVYWGWAPFETAELPPSYALLTVHRSLFTTEGLVDMCDGSMVVDDAREIRGDTTIAVHAWSPVYAEARALMTQAREVLLSLDGWVLSSEADTYDPNVRAWQVEGLWQASSVAPD